MLLPRSAQHVDTAALLKLITLIYVAIVHCCSAFGQFGDIRARPCSLVVVAFVAVRWLPAAADWMAAHRYAGLNRPHRNNVQVHAQLS